MLIYYKKPLYREDGVYCALSHDLRSMLEEPPEETEEKTNKEKGTEEKKSNQKSCCIIRAGPAHDTDMFRWKAVISGPEDSPYAGGFFHVDMYFPDTFETAPRVVMSTQIFHPNINDRGDILRLEQYMWYRPGWIKKTLYNIYGLLSAPKTDDERTLVPAIAQLYKTDHAQFMSTAKEWTKKYATEEPEPGLATVYIRK